MTTSQHLLFEWIKQNALSILVLLGGFALTVWQLKTDLASQAEKISDLKSQIGVLQTSINTVQQSQEQEAVFKEDVTNEQKTIKDNIQALYKAISDLVQRMNNLDSTERVFDTNLQLLNQQIQFLSTTKNFLPGPAPTPERYHR